MSVCSFKVIFVEIRVLGDFGRYTVGVPLIFFFFLPINILLVSINFIEYWVSRQEWWYIPIIPVFWEG